MIEAKHTPTPWTVQANPNGTLGIGAFEPDGTPCRPAKVNGNADDSVYGPVTWANAKLIVRCVNAHDDLLEACKEALAQLRFYNENLTIKNHDKELMEQLEAAIAKTSPET